MAVKVKPLFEGGPKIGGEESATPTSATQEYSVSGTDDIAAALTAAIAFAPTTYLDMKRRKWTIFPNKRADLWKIRIQWGDVSYGGSGNARPVGIQFGTGGRTRTLTQSRETIATYSADANPAPDHGGAIGVTENGVEGVEVPVPGFAWTETHKLPEVTTFPQFAALAKKRGTVNALTFRGFAPGEVLLEDVQGSSPSVDGDEWTIEFSFVQNDNIESQTAGDITGIDVGGHHYLWLTYAAKEDATAKSIVQKPRAAYVERVFPSYDFAGLGIGTGATV